MPRIYFLKGPGMTFKFGNKHEANLNPDNIIDMCIGSADVKSWFAVTFGGRRGAEGHWFPLIKEQVFEILTEMSDVKLEYNKLRAQDMMDRDLIPLSPKTTRISSSSVPLSPSSRMPMPSSSVPIVPKAHSLRMPMPSPSVSLAPKAHSLRMPMASASVPVAPKARTSQIVNDFAIIQESIDVPKLAAGKMTISAMSDVFESLGLKRPKGLKPAIINQLITIATLNLDNLYYDRYRMEELMKIAQDLGIIVRGTTTLDYRNAILSSLGLPL